MPDSYTLYMQKLGYRMVDQGTEGFQVILKGKNPLGFLKKDGQIDLVKEGEADTEKLEKAMGFFQEYGTLSQVGGKEFLVGSYHRSKLTAFFDIDRAEARFAVYGGNGEAMIYDDRTRAVLSFLELSGLREFLPVKQTLRERLRQWAVKKLTKTE